MGTMKTKRRHLDAARLTGIGVFALAMLSLGAVQSQALTDKTDYQERSESQSFAIDDRAAVLSNLVGTVEIRQARGDEIRVESTILAAGKNAGELLRNVTVTSSEKNGRLHIQTQFPVEQFDHFYYRGGSSGSYNTRVKYMGEIVRVTGKKKNDDADVFVEHIVYIPVDVQFHVMNAVGEVSVGQVQADLKLKTQSGKAVASDTRGNLVLDSGSGSLEARRHDGKLNMDTGSGAIVAENVQGDLRADSGSGSITLTDIRGSIDADTGSGRIEISRVNGDIRADTGSGRVELKEISGAIEVDSGSGRVTIENWAGGDVLNVDTGSGSVKVNGDFSLAKKVQVDTGSGSISLVSSSIPSLRVVASSRSGINVDFPQMSKIKKSRSSFRATIGSGDGEADLDTGSGKISFTME